MGTGTDPAAGTKAFSPCHSHTPSSSTDTVLSNDIEPTVNRLAGTRYCGSNGLTAISGTCEAGHYCTRGAILSRPIGQSYGGLCPAGRYCEENTAYPEPCPPGTYFPALVRATSPEMIAARSCRSPAGRM